MFDVPEAIEPILDMLLTGLADKDTVRIALAAFLRVSVAWTQGLYGAMVSRGLHALMDERAGAYGWLGR